MRVIMMVGVVIITLIMLPIRPSSAQTAQNMGCVRRISYCLNQADDILVCCPTLKDEMENERECFCSIMDVMLKNATTASAMARFLSHCSVTDSMETICSGSTPSSPSLPAAPSNTTSSSPSQPTTPSPGSPPDSTPTEISIPPPPADSSKGCWKRIAKCMEGTTTPSECCPEIKEEIENARECFCVAKDSAREDPSAANGFSKIFTMCSIPGSLDTLCPGGPPLSLTPTTPMILPPPASPGFPSKTNEAVPVSPSLDANNGTGNETTSASLSGSSNKTTNAAGLLSSSLFIIWVTNALIGYL